MNDRSSWDFPVTRSPRRLFLISFAILFLEMASIRWLNASVSVLTYFNNLILISCFFGLGIGLMLATKTIDLIRYAMVALLLMTVAIVLLEGAFGISISYTEDVILSANVEYFERGALHISAAALGGFFVNVAFFLFLGQELGKQLNAVRDPLKAYGYDIAGSLVGVVSYGVLAWLGSPPHIWYGIGGGLLLLFVQESKPWLITSAVVLGMSLFVMSTTYRSTVWSPYYKVELERYLGNDQEPIGYRINVNNIRIQDALDFGPNLERSRFRPWVHYYELPYHISKPNKALFLGAGSGNEAVVARMQGVENVTAVEIDPIIASFGYELHPNQPYRDDNVRIIVDDARSFISGTDEKFDLIVMSALDSHKQVPGMSSLRLESFVYTLESYQTIKTLLAPDGIFVLNLGSTRPWMGERTYWTLTEAWGEEPVVLRSIDSPFGSIAYVFAPPGALAVDLLPNREPVEVLPGPARPADFLLATDNWPHLYLESNRIPNIYIIVLGAMTLISFLMVIGVEPAARRPNMHFFFLGAGFMLLETRSVTQMALLFGATWNVNTIVFASILLTIFIANYLVIKAKKPSRRLSYALLFVTLVAGFFFPFKILLPLPLVARLIAAGLVIGLPIIWASFIFSISFREEEHVSKAFSSNLLGIVVGGSFEYLSNIWGLNVLYLVALALYVASAPVAPRLSLGGTAYSRS
ncbi:MAG: hypothetical protein V3T56_05650 [Gemmatimonadales bacterium]